MAGLWTPDHIVDWTTWAIITYLWITGRWGNMSLVEYPDHRVPMDIKNILELNPKARILRVWDIDEHHRLSWQMWNFQSNDTKQKAQDEIQKRLNSQLKSELKTKVQDALIFTHVLFRNIFQ